MNGTRAKGYRHDDGSYRVFSPMSAEIVEGYGKSALIRYSSQNAKTAWALHQKAGKIHIPYDVDKRFIDQITAEAQFLDRDKETGKQVLVWKEKKKGANNSHCFDTSVCALVMAMAEGLIDERQKAPEE